MRTTNDLLLLGHHLLPCGTFSGVYSREQLPRNISTQDRKQSMCLIYNTDTSNLAGIHWIAIICFPNGNGEVFDSFGRPPETNVGRWMTRHCSQGWTFNQRSVQGQLTTLCGTYCLYYLYYRIYSTVSTMNAFTNMYFPQSNNDVLLTAFDKVL